MIWRWGFNKPRKSEPEIEPAVKWELIRCAICKTDEWHACFWWVNPGEWARECPNCTTVTVTA